MKQNSFYKFTDKLFTVVTGTMCILFVLSFIQYCLGYKGVVTDETVLYCRIVYSAPMMIFLGVLTISVQFLFIASRFKETGYDAGSKFLIEILVLNIITEIFWISFLYYEAFLKWPIYVFVLAAAIAVISLILQFKLIISHFRKLKGTMENRLIIVILLLNIISEFILIPLVCAFGMEEIFYFWFPLAPLLALATKKDFRKGSDKILTVVTWLMVIIWVPIFIIPVLEYTGVLTNLATPPTDNLALALETPVTQALTAVTILAQLMFIESHINLLKDNAEGKFIITILTLNMILEIPVVILLCEYDLQFIFYLWVPTVLIFAQAAKKKLFKAIEK